MAVQTILDFYKKMEIDLLYSKAVDLMSLLDNQQLEEFYTLNPNFIEISTEGCRDIKNLNLIIDMLLKYLI